MSDVTLSYKGSDILELSDSGSATLKTGGTYCEDDIEVEYVKPSGGDSDARLVTEFDFTVPEQTSSAQTINIPFDTSTLDYYQGNVPFLLYLKSDTEPETPTLRTLVERWELFSLHSTNYQNFIGSRGYWARLVGTTGTYEYTYNPYGDVHTAAALLNALRIRSGYGIGIQLKASATQGTVQTGTWHGKLYRISGFKG